MEYIDGITLKDYIERKGVLSWKEAVHFTLQILKALQHAHDKGIVHRDIKPHNIMLLENGAIKVTDFGIARFARSEVKTITDRAIGSVHYISPEQAMGGNTDEKADIYSVGVMLFEMLTGQLPFEADSPVSVAIKQIQTQAVRPRSLNPGIPEGLEDITVRAMQKDVAQRYQSAGEMIQDIERFKQNPGIHFDYKYTAGSGGAKGKKRRKPGGNNSQEEEGRQRRRAPYIPILTGVTFAFVLAAALFIALMVYMNNPFAQVAEEALPDLVGEKYETAVTKYDWIEIVEGQDARENSDKYSVGEIMEQKPKAGTKVKVGSTVTVKISLGQAVITLPDFAGQDATQTVARISDLGLIAEERRDYSPSIPAGSVIYTNPSKDATLSAGDTVEVWVSMGPEETLVNVPNVEGYKLDDARTRLDLSKLRVGNVTYAQDSDYPADTIISQDPAAGTLQLEGTSINLVVSKGSSDFKRLTIPVQLPSSIDRTVTLQATQDGELVQQDKLKPSETPVWNPYFEGEEDIVTIKIYLDGKLYQEYSLDFETKGRILEQDNSDAFE